MAGGPSSRKPSRSCFFTPILIILLPSFACAATPSHFRYDFLTFLFITSHVSFVLRADMSETATTTPAAAAPKAVIGSHLTRNYREENRPSGFICGCTSSFSLPFCFSRSLSRLRFALSEHALLPFAHSPSYCPFPPISLARAISRLRFLACSTQNQVTLGADNVVCHSCGYRILYKMRQRRRTFTLHTDSFSHASLLHSLYLSSVFYYEPNTLSEDIH